MKAIVNIGALYDAIAAKGWNGVVEAARMCHVAPDSFHKLERGELPRYDAIRRISIGCGIPISAFIIGATRHRGGGEVRELKERTGT